MHFPASRSLPSSHRVNVLPSTGSWRRSRAAAAISSCTAPRAAARPRSTSRRVPSPSNAIVERSSWFRRSPSHLRRSAASASGSAIAVAVLHSALTDAQRRDERERIAMGDARVVVGARSAVFAPVRNLGLVIVDEEHDASYKQESDPRYDARTVAAKRATLEAAVAVYGSATPRPESWARLERLELAARIGAPMPKVRLVDLRREAGYPLSAPLLAELARLEEHGGRAILLLNRRGVSGAVHCRACGTSRRCRSCDVALTLHQDERLHCHHCGFTEPLPEQCPECGSVDLARIGAGTQRLESELATSRAGPRPDQARRRHRRPPRSAPPRLSSGSRARGLPCSSARRWWQKGTTFPVSPWPPWSMPTRGSPFRTSGPRSARSSSSPSSPAEAGAMHPESCSCRRSSQMRRRSPTPRVTTSRAFSRRSSPAAKSSAIRHSATSCRSSCRGPTPRGRSRSSRSFVARWVGPTHSFSGPAPLLRLRGRHRAQLVAKTNAPRALAAKAAEVLAAAAPAMRKRGLQAVVDVDPQSV